MCPFYEPSGIDNERHLSCAEQRNAGDVLRACGEGCKLGDGDLEAALDGGDGKRGRAHAVAQDDQDRLGAIGVDPGRGCERKQRKQSAFPLDLVDAIDGSNPGLCGRHRSLYRRFGDRPPQAAGPHDEHALQRLPGRHPQCDARPGARPGLEMHPAVQSLNGRRQPGQAVAVATLDGTGREPRLEQERNQVLGVRSVLVDETHVETGLVHQIPVDTLSVVGENHFEHAGFEGNVESDHTDARLSLILAPSRDLQSVIDRVDDQLANRL